MEFCRIIVLLFVGAAAVWPFPVRGGDVGDSRSRFIAGQFLVASPGMADPRFKETVIYMIGHDAKGAMGLVINRPFGSGRLSKMMEGFGINTNGVEAAGDAISLYYGGPVEPGRGFVLHSGDYSGPGVSAISDEVSLTSRLEILDAIAKGEGPRHSLVILGYAGWGAGQLEHEMARDDWTTAPADLGLIFSDDPKSTWERVTKLSGVEL